MNEPRKLTRIALWKVRGRMAEGRRRLVNRAGGRLFRAMDRAYAAASTIPVVPILPRDTFEWVARLEAKTPVIRRELDALLEDYASLPRFQDISPNQKRISPGDDWRTYFFRGFGHDSQAAALLCPETSRILAEIPRLETAFFSILEPGTVIPEHRGVSRGLVRCHLPLVVPADRGACFMDIGGERHSWRAGEAFLFDDTFRHSVRNDTSERRVVLLLDVERPMSARGRLLLRSSLRLLGATHYVEDGLRNQACWEQRYARSILDRRAVGGDGVEDAAA